MRYTHVIREKQSIKVTKYFIPLIETTGDVQTSEWIIMKGDTLLIPLLT